MVIKKVGTLEIEEEALESKAPFWRTQRICLVFMILFLISVFLGITGSGLLSRKIISSSDQSFTINYDRFGRNTVPNTINIIVNQPSKTIVTISINKSYLENQEIVEIAPRPAKVIDAGDKFNFYFLTTALNPTNILFKLRPENMGRFKGKIFLEESTALNINQFIFP